MSEIIETCYAERIPPEELSLDNGRIWYIPHHGVYHPKKPGKIRVVFDASAECKGESLNRQLLQGLDLTKSDRSVMPILKGAYGIYLRHGRYVPPSERNLSIETF